MGNRVICGVAGRVGCLVVLVLACGTGAFAQKSRLGTAVDGGRRVALQNQVHPRATAENDQGRAAATMLMQGMSLALKPSPEQQAALEALLARQQDPASADYHHWLTPEEYADRFGVSVADIATLKSWLEARNLSVISVARGRNSIAFRGTVAQVESAFGAEIHRYVVSGERHFANSVAPSIPAAFEGMVGSIRGLHDFRPQARGVGKARYTAGSDTTIHFLAPDDVATIYDIAPLLNAGIDGTGQKIAIVGQSQIDVNDIREFRTSYNLPASDPQIVLVPGFADPGFSAGDQDESSLDIEWSGAVARKASILFVYSADVTDALQYAIDQKLAPVVSMSYGLCESQTTSGDQSYFRTLAQKAGTLGITWLAASGDSGATDCYDPTSRTQATLDVDLPASIPEVTGVGGLTFNEGSGSYWKLSNDGSLASAMGYIPEMIWNDSVTGNAAAGGGGKSAAFAKPVWQTGPGVPADNARDVPDVSFAASAAHDPYLFYSGGVRSQIGGTSVGTPLFAGVIALLNQYQVANGFQATAGLGNINPQLYALAVSNPGAFHDITNGNNSVNPCGPRVRVCSSSTPIGYAAGPGYDLASGLGSVDAFNFVSGWNLKAATRAAVTLSVTSSVASIPLTGSAVLTATVTGTGALPSGTVTFAVGGVTVGGVTVGGVTLGSATLTGSGKVATATLTVKGATLTPGAWTITSAYSGDATYGAAGGLVGLTVMPAAAMTITGVTNAASFQQVYAPGMILAIFGTGLAGTTQSAPLVPLPTQMSGVNVTINGYLSPLYFISPGQINVQIPYSYFPVGPAVVKVSYNGQSVTSNFTITSAAPGIFADSTGETAPVSTVKRGDTVSLYITGDGLATPAPDTGHLPTGLTTPKPVQKVSVTVGGVAATTSFVGIPSWSIGATQINYTIPATAPLGKQPVVVTVGSTASSPATVTITQ